MPNSNTSFSTATDIGTLTGTTAYTTTQDAWNGSSADDLYFSYTPVSGDDVLEISGTGDVTNYRVQTTVWYGPAGSPTQIGSTADNRPMQQDIVTGVTSGQPIFVKCHATLSANPSTLTLRIARGQKQSIASSDLFINDSTSSYPGIVMDPTTAIPKRYILNFPAGEGMEVLSDGTVAVQDDTNVSFSTYTASSSGLTLRATPTNPFTPSGSFDCLGSNHVDTFWGGDNGAGATHAKMFSFDRDGAVGTTLDLAAASILKSLAPNSGNTKVYFVKNNTSTAQSVFVIDTSNSAISTFVTGVASKVLGANLLMLTDDTLLIPYEQSGVDTFIRRYDESATLLGTYTLSGTTGGIERIFNDPADPAYFWVWWQTTTLNKFWKIDATTYGTVTPAVNLSRMKFVQGISEEGATASPSAYSGADFSCVPVVLRQVSASNSGPAGSSGRRGIYVPTRGDAGSEGGGSNARFQDLNGYPSTSTGFSTTVAGRIIHVQPDGPVGGPSSGLKGLGKGRAIYVPTVGIGGAEGDGRDSDGATVGIRRIVVYDGEGYTHR